MLLPLLSGQFLFGAENASAQMPCDGDLKEVLYDGCLLPYDPNQEFPWTVEPDSGGIAYVENCELVLEVPTGESLIFQRFEPSLATAESYAIEASLQFDSCQGSILNPTNGGIGISDASRIAFIDSRCENNHLEFLACDMTGCPSVEVDLAEQHMLRIEIDTGGQARFLVDGRVFHSVPYTSLFRQGQTNPTVEEAPNLSVFGAAGSVTRWDEVNYEICTASAPSNQPPVAEAGEGFEALQGTWVQLDGSASYDPDGDLIEYLWVQHEGPRVHLDNPLSPKPGFVVPAGPDMGTLVFTLAVFDGQELSAPDQVIVLTRAQAPEESLASLLAEVQAANLPQHQNQLEHLLEDAINDDECQDKVDALNSLVTWIERGRDDWIDAETADRWLDQVMDQAEEIGPCVSSCRVDGGIEGDNIAEGARVYASIISEMPSLLCTGCNGFGSLFDGDEETAWVAEGFGHELSIDLGSKQVITGFRVISPNKQTYRIEAWDNLAQAWIELVDRTEASSDATDDTCDMAARYLRLTHKETLDSPDTAIAEFQVLGHKTRQLKMEWLGTDPALNHEGGQAIGTSWLITPSDGIDLNMSALPRVRMTPGKRWAEFFLVASSVENDGEALASVIIYRLGEQSRMEVARENLRARAGNLTASIPFIAESGTRYAFDIQYLGGADLVLHKIVVKDHPGTFATAPLH